MASPAPKEGATACLFGGRCRLREGSGCVCDLRALVGRFDDWRIAQLTGVATYAQLLDAGPGLFKAFADCRSDGNTCAAITSFNGTAPREGVNGTISIEAGAPPPPNLVSTILATGQITPAGIKRALIRASRGCVYDPLVEPLIGTSMSYRSPEMPLGNLIVVFIVFAIVVSLVLGAALLYLRGYASLL